MTTQGIGASTSANAAKTVNAQPYPMFSARGGTVKGKNAPIRQRVTSTAVIAEAEYLPKASVTKVIVGMSERTRAIQRSVTVARKNQTRT